MTLRPLLSAAALVASIGFPVLAHAQAEISAAEEQRLEALARENAEIYLPKSHVTVGFRVLSSGAKVNFSRLGAVDFSTTVAPSASGAVRRVYDNGFVDTDALTARTQETPGSKTETTATTRTTTTTTPLPAGRYELKIDTVSAGDDGALDTGDDVTTSFTRNFLSYVAGLTRTWAYTSPEQAALRPGFIAMNSYSAVSDGAAMAKQQGPTGGIELQFTRLFGKGSSRVQWGMSTGISLTGINGKTAGEVRSTLRTNTDFFSLNGLTAPVASLDQPYQAPSFSDQLDAQGVVVLSGAVETTVPLGATPVDHVETAAPGAATVHGNWQVKGAYFMVKLGPSVHAQLTDRFGLTASLGLAGAYAGTNYSAAESFEIPVIGGTLQTPDPTQSNASEFLGGYYADVNLEWAVNDRTGLFGGFTAQKLGDYEQTLGTRTARVDLGSTVGLRAGVSIRF